MSNTTNRYAYDWWVVEKRMIYLLIALVTVCVLAAGAGIYVWKFGNPLKNVGVVTKAPGGARFTSFEGDVRVIRAATRETVIASGDTELFPGDTVQTQASGRARVSMADGSTLVVRPNSTITIRDNASDDGGKKANVHVVVDSGQMSVRTENQPDGTNNVVETPKATSKIGEQTAATFGVQPEGTEDIRVNTGAVQLTSRTGEKVTFRAGDYVSINPSGTISKPQKLLDVPLLSEPHDLQRVFVGEKNAANVSLKWLRPQTGTAAFYRVEVATSPFFVSDGIVIGRDQLVSTEFTVSDLRPGAYFWRVRGIAQSGQMSDWSDPKKFTIVARGSGSGVSVADLNAEHLHGNVYLIRGRSSPGTTIRIAGREMLVPSSGTFQLQTTAPQGTQEIAVDAIDPQGNSSPYRISISKSRGND